LADGTAAPRARVVIIGGGFGGLYAARTLKRAAVDVTLVDRRNFHLFQPLLYQVATGGLSPGEIASPLRGVLRRQRNTRVVLAEATHIDARGRRVVLSDGSVDYDYLIVAAGARHHYFGHADWAARAPGLKTIEDATEIRRRVFLAFEAAERESDEARRRAWLTFVIVGAGATGVELAGALSEIAHHTLKRDFRNINSREARILLVEAAPRVLPPYTPNLSSKAERVLRRLRVEIRLDCMVQEIGDDSVTVSAAGEREVIGARTVLWAAGVQASSLGQDLARETGVQLDRAGRVIVEPDCSIAGFGEIFVIGDQGCFHDAAGQPLPGVAPVAMQQGRYVAHCIEKRLRGESSPPFKYWDKGSMAVIGRGAAVAKMGRLEFNGNLAWLAWLFVHLMYLVEFDNRLLVLLQWAWNYLTWNRGARLITGESPLPLGGLSCVPEHPLPRAHSNAGEK
jgi:NADH dehydrogenase